MQQRFEKRKVMQDLSTGFAAPSGQDHSSHFHVLASVVYPPEVPEASQSFLANGLPRRS
jgi:hypothetical protein